MDKNLWIGLLIFVVFIIYVVAKVRMYMRQSDAQWKQVDKSKLKDWQDEDD